MRRAEAEQLTGCTTGTLTADEYHGLLLASGFTGIRITAIQAAGPGLRSAIIQARRPAALDEAELVAAVQAELEQAGRPRRRSGSPPVNRTSVMPSRSTATAMRRDTSSVSSAGPGSQFRP